VSEQLIRPGVLEGWEEWSAYCMKLERLLLDMRPYVTGLAGIDGEPFTDRIDALSIAGDAP
jgi:hypothetical protein